MAAASLGHFEQDLRQPVGHVDHRVVAGRHLVGPSSRACPSPWQASRRRPGSGNRPRGYRSGFSAAGRGSLLGHGRERMRRAFRVWQDGESKERQHGLILQDGGGSDGLMATKRALLGRADNLNLFITISE